MSTTQITNSTPTEARNRSTNPSWLMLADVERAQQIQCSQSVHLPSSRLPDVRPGRIGHQCRGCRSQFGTRGNLPTRTSVRLCRGGMPTDVELSAWSQMSSPKHPLTPHDPLASLAASGWEASPAGSSAWPGRNLFKFWD